MLHELYSETTPLNGIDVGYSLLVPLLGRYSFMDIFHGIIDRRMCDRGAFKSRTTSGGLAEGHGNGSTTMLLVKIISSTG